MSTSNIIVEGVTIPQLYSSGYSTNTVEADDLILIIRNGSELVIRAGDLLVSRWDAELGEPGYIDKSANIVYTTSNQNISNKTFRACAEFAYPVSTLTNGTANLTYLDGNMSYEVSATGSCYGNLPSATAARGRVLVVSLTLAAGATFTLQPYSNAGVPDTIVVGEDPVEVPSGKTTVLTLLAGTKTWYMQGKTFT